MPEQLLQTPQPMELHIPHQDEELVLRHELLASPEEMEQYIRQTIAKEEDLRISTLLQRTNTLPSPTVLQAQNQPLPVVQAPPEQSRKARRQLEKERQKKLKAGQKVSAYADVYTADILAQQQVPHDPVVAPNAVALAELLAQKALRVCVTPDQFAPENFVANYADLQEHIYTLRGLQESLLDATVAQALEAADPIGYLAVRRALDLLPQIEGSFKMSCYAHGITEEGQGIEDPTLVEYSREAITNQLGILQAALQESEERRSVELSAAIDEDVLLCSAEHTEQFRQLGEQLRTDNPEMAWITAPLTSATQFQLLQEVHTLFTQHAEAYATHQTPLNAMLDELCTSMEAYAALNGRVAVLTELKQRYLSQEQQGRQERNLMQRMVSARIGGLSADSQRIMERFEMLRSAVRSLLTETEPAPLDSLVLAEFGVQTPEEQDHRQSIIYNATEYARQMESGNAIVNRLKDDSRVNLQGLSPSSLYYDRVTTMMREGDDDYNIEMLNFIARYSQGVDNPTPELYREARAKLLPLIHAVWQADVDGYVAMDDATLQLHAGEIAAVFKYNMFLVDLLKLRTPEELNGFTPFGHEEEMTLKSELLGDRREEFNHRISMLRALQERSRALAIKSYALYGLPLENAFTSNEWRKNCECSREGAYRFAQSRFTLSNQLLSANQKRHQDANTLDHPLFRERFDKLHSRPWCSPDSMPFADIRLNFERQLSFVKGTYVPKPEDNFVPDPRLAGVMHRLSGTSFSLAGWTKEEQQASGLPAMPEAVFRSFNSYLYGPAGRTMSEEQYLQMLMDLGAGDGMKRGVTDETELQAAREQNMRGLRAYKETMRLQYDYLTRKYGLSVEQLDLVDLANHWEEMLADCANMQVDLNIANRIPGVIDPNNPQDVELGHKLEYFNIIMASILGSLKINYGTGYMSQDDLRQQALTVAQGPGLAAHRQYIIEHANTLGLRQTGGVDWSAQMGERRETH